MAITDIDISETLKTNAPSIKYRGNEGPKSPQEEQMIMEQQQMAAIDPMMQKKLKLIEELMSQGYDFGSASNLADKILAGQDEQEIGMAYGGIAGLDGRRRYGLGSKFKKFVRKIIPNEVARVAEVAAPFIAPFNPLAGAIAGGLGSFDRTGSLGGALKSGLMNYGLGQVARGIGGGMENLQGMSLRTPQGTFFSSPMQKTGGLGKILNERSLANAANAERAAMADANIGHEAFDKKPGFIESIGEKISSLIPESTLGKVALGGSAIALGTQLLGQGPEETVDVIMDRGEGLDLDSIRLEVREAFKDPSGQKLLALRNKYPFLGAKETKNIDLMAQGGRIGYDNGGGVAGMREALKNKGYDWLDDVDDITVRQIFNSEMGTWTASDVWRPGKQEGGIMDLGGMEKDYRNTGGFVDIGAKEKADDVPARLSVNEFVMTADAVRGAGGGDIDKGAEIMERVMENLENGGRISEESQGLKGAQEMFEVSERLSEVV